MKEAPPTFPVTWPRDKEEALEFLARSAVQAAAGFLGLLIHGRKKLKEDKR